MPPTINLALFFHPEKSAASDMETIRDEIRRIDRGIRTFLFPSTREYRWSHLRLLGRPTVSIELGRPRGFRFGRMVRLRHLTRGKIGPSAVIRDAGLPIPRYEVITPGLRLDPKEWGPYVVVKPDLGGRGAYVRIQKTGRVRYRGPEELDADDPGRRGARIVQRFIHTGPYPVSFRVLTLFGEPLGCTRYEGRHDVMPLDEPDDFGRSGSRPIVASAKGCTITLWHDEEMLALARRVHALFPTVPTLGQDFMRDARTGELHIIEVNPNGSVWFFSNRSGREIQQKFGFDLYSQFDALPTAARTLAAVARRYAR
jgi:hypothetical protein